jgi:hypothetical protein
MYQLEVFVPINFQSHLSRFSIGLWFISFVFSAFSSSASAGARRPPNLSVEDQAYLVRQCAVGLAEAELFNICKESATNGFEDLESCMSRGREGGTLANLTESFMDDPGCVRTIEAARSNTSYPECELYNATARQRCCADTGNLDACMAATQAALNDDVPVDLEQARRACREGASMDGSDYQCNGKCVVDDPGREGAPHCDPATGEFQADPVVAEPTPVDCEATPDHEECRRRSGDDTRTVEAEEDLDGDGDIDETDNAIATEQANAAAGGEIQDLATQCMQRASRANQCCNGPLECLTNGSDVSGTVNEVVGFGGQMAMQILGAQAGDNAGVAKLCEFLKTASNISAGMNAAGAGTCLAGKTGCIGACEAGLDKINQCAGGSCGLSEVQLDEHRGTFQRGIGMCQGLNEHVAQQAMQSVTAAQGAQFANDCAVAAEQQIESTGADDLVETDRLDCTKAENQDSPYCMECTDPSAANNPFCQNPYAQNGPGGAGLAQDGSVGAAAFGADDGANAAVDPGMEGIEQNYYGNATEGVARSNGVGGGGGGGGVGGGGAGGASLGGDGRRGGRGGGHNANVLKGVSGGGGYSSRPSVARVGVSSQGGFAGYGKRAKKPKNGLDLKQFLPGGKKDPRKRKLAGLANADGPVIGRKEENIFHKMAKKYQQMCKLKRMWDCPALKKKQ